MSTFGTEDTGKKSHLSQKCNHMPKCWLYMTNPISEISKCRTGSLRAMSRNGIMLPGWIEHITQHLLTAFLIHLKTAFLNENVVFALDLHLSLSHSTVNLCLRTGWSTVQHLNIHVQHLPYDRSATKMGLTHFFGAHHQDTNTSTVIDYALSPGAFKNNQQVIEQEGNL